MGVAAAVLFQEAGVVLELAAVAAAGVFVLPGFLNGRGGSDSSPSGGTLKRQVKCGASSPTLLCPFRSCSCTRTTMLCLFRALTEAAHVNVTCKQISALPPQVSVTGVSRWMSEGGGDPLQGVSLNATSAWSYVWALPPAGYANMRGGVADIPGRPVCPVSHDFAQYILLGIDTA